MTETTLSTTRLANLVAGKHKILELLVQLARRQLALAQEGEIGDLMKLLAAKQTVLGQLQTLERELDPFRPQDPEARAWALPADRQRCQAQANRCDELLAEAMRLEKLGEAEMVRRRDAAASVLQGAGEAAVAQSAYAGAAPVVSSPLQFHCEG
jgi:flagellar biosynthesis/type III secretory pathway chaperone